MSGVGYRPPAVEVAPADGDTSVATQYPSYSWWKLFYAILGIALLVLIIYVTVETLTRPDTEFIVGEFILSISPEVWGSLGLSIAFFLSVLGAGW